MSATEQTPKCEFPYCVCTADQMCKHAALEEADAVFDAIADHLDFAGDDGDEPCDADPLCGHWLCHAAGCFEDKRAMVRAARRAAVN